MNYLLKIYWSWGRNSRFEEIEEIVLGKEPSDTQIKEWLNRTWDKIRSKYEFDCGRVDMPLYPCIWNYTLTKQEPIKINKLNLDKYHIKRA